jgi:hypothetical protein
MSDHIQTSILAVQVLALVGLIWYAWETRGMRKASQDQVEVSQGLMNAAMAQVEGLSKPCLTLWSGLRDGADAILNTHGAVGNTIAQSDHGSFVVQNIGNGVALNVSYRFVQLIQTGLASRPGEIRYVQNVLASQKVTMAEPMGPFGGEWEVHFEYQSMGGRKYQSIVTMNNHVLTAFVFKSIPEKSDKNDDSSVEGH